MIKNCSKEYKQKRIPISTQKYKDGGVMEKFLLDLTIKVINQEKVMTTTEVQYVVGSFAVKLRDLNVSNFLYTTTSK